MARACASAAPTRPTLSKAAIPEYSAKQPAIRADIVHQQRWSQVRGSVRSRGLRAWEHFPPRRLQVWQIRIAAEHKRRGAASGGHNPIVSSV